MSQNKKFEAVFNELFKKNNFPVSVTLEYTTQCNFNCIHCFRNKYPVENELTLDEWKSIAKQLSENGVLMLNITGGEPLLRSDLFEFIKFCRDLKFSVKLKTNGSLLDEEKIKMLKELKIQQVQLSFYAGEPRLFESITKTNGSYENVVNAIRIIKENDIPINIGIVLMKNNYKFLVQTIKKAQQLGVEYTVDPQISGVVCRGDITKELKLSQDELVSIYKQLPYEEVCGRFSHDGKNLDVGLCQGISISFTVKADGDIWPCQLFEYPLGNIKQNNLKQVWESDKAKNLRNLTWNDLPECKLCEHVSHCMRCTAQAYIETGNISAPSLLHCTQIKAMKEVCKKVVD